MSLLRIGITMRTSNARHYDEPRDSLAQDWANFMSAYLPGVCWLALPNMGSSITSYAEQWGLNALILSGGNDLDSAPQRDATEVALLTWAVGRNIPVLGVCRGLEMIQHFFGGSLTRCHDTHAHAHSHSIQWLKTGEKHFVNSYHQWGVVKTHIAQPLEILALSQDDTVEALQHRELPILGVQWHPERCGPQYPGDSLALDQRLLQDLFAPQTLSPELAL